MSTEMKRLMIGVFAAVIFSACQNSKEETKPTVVLEFEEVDKTEEVERIFGKFTSLYQELIDFKGKEDFRKYGFGEGGAYKNWLNEVEKLENNPNSKLLLQKGVVAGELKSLGMEYVSSGGNETEVSKSFNKIFLEAIHGKEIAEVSDIDDVDFKSNVVGKWLWKHSAETTITISRSDGGYYALIAYDKYFSDRTEELEIKDNRYYIKNSKTLEYYNVTADGNLEIGDNQGIFGTGKKLAIQ